MNIFETPATMPADPSKDVVRVPLAEPQDRFNAQVPYLRKDNHHVEHAPIPKIGRSV